jgi:hypothetical protein
VQADLLTRLTAKADSVADIPAAQMDALVTGLLDPLPVSRAVKPSLCV